MAVTTDMRFGGSMETKSLCQPSMYDEQVGDDISIGVRYLLFITRSQLVFGGGLGVTRSYYELGSV